VKPPVVLPSLVAIRQDFVGLLYLLEALLGSGVFGVGIRMVLADELTRCSLDSRLRKPLWVVRAADIDPC